MEEKKQNIEQKRKESEKEKSADVSDTGRCNDKRCPVHGALSVRGRRFKGYVKKIHGKNATIEFERFVYVAKYERYSRTKTRLHAHIPDCLASSVKEGIYIEIGECRPLTKTIHHVITSIENKGTPPINPQQK